MKTQINDKGQTFFVDQERKRKVHHGFAHELSQEGITNDWMTPPYILNWFNNLNKTANKQWWFDLDPCASLHQLYKTANSSFTIHDDGMSQKWYGFYIHTLNILKEMRK